MEFKIVNPDAESVRVRLGITTERLYSFLKMVHSVEGKGIGELIRAVVEHANTVEEVAYVLYGVGVTSRLQEVEVIDASHMLSDETKAKIAKLVEAGAFKNGSEAFVFKEPKGRGFNPPKGEA